MKIIQIAKNPYTSFVVNLVFAVYNCVIGFSAHSWWFITIGSYYTILASTRLFVLKSKDNKQIEIFVKRVTGVLLIVLSFCLIGMNILSGIKERGTAFHEIVMIAFATYSFTKITIAIIGMVRSKHKVTPIVKTLRNIAFADAVVSVSTLQRSMLVSFPGMKPYEIQIMNIMTGTVVYVVVLLLGINLVGGKRVDMAKSKIVKAGKKIAEETTDGYKFIEKHIVNVYRKIKDKFM